jgi:primosomal replication protein N
MQALRHTPAGIAIVNFRLQHRSEQIEERAARQVEVELAAQAVGQVAERLSRLPDGAAIRVSGFLAKRSRTSDFPVLHVNQFKAIEEVNHGI